MVFINRPEKKAIEAKFKSHIRNEKAKKIKQKHLLAYSCLHPVRCIHF